MMFWCCCEGEGRCETSDFSDTFAALDPLWNFNTGTTWEVADGVMRTPSGWSTGGLDVYRCVFVGVNDEFIFEADIDYLDPLAIASCGLSIRGILSFDAVQFWYHRPTLGTAEFRGKIGSDPFFTIAGSTPTNGYSMRLEIIGTATPGQYNVRFLVDEGTGFGLLHDELATLNIVSAGEIEVGFFATPVVGITGCAWDNASFTMSA